jgi:hypothetical protein
MVQQMMQNNPQMAAMLQNPEFLRQLSDPNTMQQVLLRVYLWRVCARAPPQCYTRHVVSMCMVCAGLRV